MVNNKNDNNIYINNDNCSASEHLYNINAFISIRTYILQKKFSLSEMGDLNTTLGELIKKVRLLEANQK